MDKRHIVLLCVLVFLLAAFFQFSRMDGFLHFGIERNILPLPPLAGQEQEAKGRRDRYLIIYDNHDVPSVFARHRLEWLLNQEKKDHDYALVGDRTLEDFSAYRGVLIATGYLDKVAAWEKIRSYVEAGGTAACLMRPESAGDEGLSEAYLAPLGIKAVKGEGDVKGISLLTDFLCGGKGYAFGDTAYSSNTTLVELAPEATVHISSYDGNPLLWEKKQGQGKYYVFDGIVRDDKTNIGLLTSLVNHCGEDSLYPVLGYKVFYIDDFPAPVPEGNFQRIYDELGVSTPEFYRNVWWPFMRECAEEFGLKYTGLIIESYGDQVKGPFQPLGGRAARDSLIIYGRELLDMGGELGLHGYNHQSLAPESYQLEDLDYVPWESQQDMLEALLELRRYIKEAYPEYHFRCYVPPSDILSPEGKEAIREAFPEVDIFSSLFDGPYASRAYIQDYERKDGLYEMPRTTAGYSPNGQALYEDISMMNYMGCFSHFVHPDELFYEESAHLTWADMTTGFKKYMGEIISRYGWLKPVTASEAAQAFDDYLDMDYRVERSPEKLTLTCWNYRHPLRFILRSARELDHAEGAEVTKFGDTAYLIEALEPESVLYWKEEP